LGGVAAAGAGFVRVIGSRGAGNGQLQYPFGGIALDGEGNLVVCDSENHRIQVLRYSDGAHLRSIGGYGDRNGQFRQPRAVAFDGAGHIIVSENSGTRARVQMVRFSDGAHVRTFEGVHFVSSIAVDGQGNAAAFARFEAQIYVLRLRDGVVIRILGSPGSDNGQFMPGGDSGIAFDVEGNIVVADYYNNRVQVLRYIDGVHIRTIGSAGSGAGQFKLPTGVAFDATGHIVVCDHGNHRMQVLRYSDGAHIRSVGSSKGSGNGQFSGPLGGIAIDSDGRIVVPDSGNHRVQVLE
jgi:sugar lactone lactonase YvrE